MYIRAQAARRGRSGGQMQEWEEGSELLENEMAEIRAETELEVSGMHESYGGRC